MPFNESIKAARLKSGLSQEKAGAAIDRTRNAIKGYEEGISSPNPDQLAILCRLFNTTPNDLLGFQYQQQNEEAKMKHTSTPWVAFKDGAIQTEGREVIAWPSGLAKKNMEANAAFIVKACNSHYRLLDLLQEMTDKTEAMCEHFDATGHEDLVSKCRKEIEQAEDQS